MKNLILSVLYCLFAAVASSAATASEPPQSVRYDHSNVSLLAGSFGDGKWSAGVEIGMGPGWKTYWRVPGEAGVPPYFDWKGSTNLSAVEVSWPAPKRYHDEAGESIGYKDHVVFPMTVTPKDASKPVRLMLDLFYAVCNDICIPGSAKLSVLLDDPAGKPADIALIEEYRGKVPAPKSGSLKLENVAVEEYGGDLVLAVRLAGATPEAKPDIFVEGSDEIYFRKPELAMADGPAKVYHLRIDGAQSVDQLKGQKLMLTIVDEAGAMSRQTTVD